MFFTIVILIVYVGFVGYLAFDINRIKNELYKKGAFSPDTAVFTEIDALGELLFLNNQFSFLCIKETPDGKLWINTIQWRNNVILFFFTVAISVLTFVGIFFNYL